MNAAARTFLRACTRALLCVFGLVALVVPAAAAPDIDVRMTASGAIRGVSDDHSINFRGIPYALPPVGPLRWRAPQPALPWTGVRDAAVFGPACTQADRPGVVTSEDCLTLNVSTPRSATPHDRLPVLVRFHGGGLVSGSGAVEHAADVWNAEGIVLVTMNYRLGPLGFFAHPLLEAEAQAKGEPYLANPALLDMKAALEWVQANIAVFNGDPTRVTIAGVSAGGEAVDLLLVTPGLNGLFAGAIASSGYAAWPLPKIAALDPVRRTRFSNAEALDEKLVVDAAAGAPIGSAEDLRALPAKALTGAVKGFILPIIDGRTILADPLELYAAGRRHPVPFLTGGNSFEGSVMANSGITADDVSALLGTHAADADRAYASDVEVSRDLAVKRIFGDMRYVLSSDLIAKRDPQNAPLFLYYNAYVPPARRATSPGAPHASETMVLERGTYLPHSPGAAMRGYWSNFIKTGDPNRPAAGPTPWPQAGRDHLNWMVFDDHFEVKTDVIANRLAVLEAARNDLEHAHP
jgi:para-nitrobenzyl esterase